MINAGSCHNADSQSITGVDVSLGSCTEHILNERHCLLNCQWSLYNSLLVLVANLMAERERKREGGGERERERESKIYHHKISNYTCSQCHDDCTLRSTDRRLAWSVATLTWLSNNGCSIEAADPPARYVSLSYDPTGSKLYTQPLPAHSHTHMHDVYILANAYIPSLSSPAKML